MTFQLEYRYDVGKNVYRSRQKSKQTGELIIVEITNRSHRTKITDLKQKELKISKQIEITLSFSVQYLIDIIV